MTAKRAKTLKWIGNYFPDGRPERHMAEYGIPVGDLDEAQTAELSDHQVKIAIESGLYEAGDAPKHADKSATGGEG